MEKLISFCSQVAETSNEFEKNNSELKRNYWIYNIMLYNYVSRMISGVCGTFGTGYPFYVLNKNLTGKLPIIDEQIRYNDDLICSVENSNHTTWSCFMCLSKNINTMPDLKQICKPCPNMDNALKPRKILNRLPDVDMWMVCEDSFVNSVCEQAIILFNEYNMHSSDINPIKTIEDVMKITEMLKIGIMPEKLLPFDAHVIDYSTFYSLIEQVPSVLEDAIKNNRVPYLPIHPLSYRRKWQYDDTAYNFIHDYLSSLTEFNFKDELKQKLYETRNIIANSYSFEQLYDYLISTGPDSVKRRHRTPEIKDRFKERIELWKKY